MTSLMPNSGLLINRKKGGFTLIEMMVSVAIFGVIASIIFPALIQFLDARDRIDTKHEQIIGMQKTFLFLARDIRFASNRLGKDEFGELGKATLDVGNESLIELTALYPDLNLDGLGVPRRVRWVLEDNTLQRIQYPVMDPDQDTRIIRQKLLTNVQSVEIQLSDVVDGRNEVSNSWDSETRLPDLLEMTVELESGIEYRRTFTMIDGDKLEALASGLSAAGNANGGDNSDDQAVDNDDASQVEL